MNTKDIQIGSYFGYPIFIKISEDLPVSEVESIIESFKWTLWKGNNCDGRHESVYDFTKFKV